MAITISGTDGIVGAGFTVDASGVSVTAGVGTFSSLQGSGANLTALPAANLTGTLPALSAASLTSIPAANIVGVCTSGLTKTGGFGKIVQVVSTTKTNTASNSTASSAWWSYTDTSLRVSITPTSATNKILIMGVTSISVDSQQYLMVRLEKDGSRLNDANGDQDGNKSRVFCGTWYSPETTPQTTYPTFMVQYLDTAGNTSSRYYNFGFAHTSGATRTMYLNASGRTTDNFATMLCASTITAIEIEA